MHIEKSERLVVYCSFLWLFNVSLKVVILFVRTKKKKTGKDCLKYWNRTHTHTYSTTLLLCLAYPLPPPLSSLLSPANRFQQIHFDTTLQHPQNEDNPWHFYHSNPLLFSLRSALPVLFADKICQPIQALADHTSKRSASPRRVMKCQNNIPLCALDGSLI